MILISVGLSDMQAKLLHEHWKHIVLFIIDEVSMLSRENLDEIHHRLQRICRNEKPFGGMNVLVLGDLLQLQPVTGLFYFVSFLRLSAHYYLGNCVYTPPPMQCPSLWHGKAHRDPDIRYSPFNYFELTQNMRQREELDFAEMLGRIRIGCPSNTDYEVSFMFHIFL